MTTERNALAQYRNDYLDYLEGDRSDPPPIEVLDASDQARARAWMDSIEAARGIDPYASRPSVEELLGRATETGSPAQADPVDGLGEAIESHLNANIDPTALVVADPAASAAGMNSLLVIYSRGIRLRVVIEPEGTDLDQAFEHSAAAISALFGAFPDTSAVLYVELSADASGVVVDADDVQTAIETPGGAERPARIRRPLGPAAEACAAYLREVLPSFTPMARVDHAKSGHHNIVDLEQIVGHAVETVTQDGRRAKTDEKTETWTALTTRDTEALVALGTDARERALSEEDYERSLDHIVGSAA